ncbi:MAG: hypothetical protein IPJ34_02420 [Myxococcales bacterium]|nr:hypothetical protein [Myxococcales bacterium]
MTPSRGSRPAQAGDRDALATESTNRRTATPFSAPPAERRGHVEEVARDARDQGALQDCEGDDEASVVTHPATDERREHQWSVAEQHPEDEAHEDRVQGGVVHRSAGQRTVLRKEQTCHQRPTRGCRDGAGDVALTPATGDRPCRWQAEHPGAEQHEPPTEQPECRGRGDARDQDGPGDHRERERRPLAFDGQLPQDRRHEEHHPPGHELEDRRPANGQGRGAEEDELGDDLDREEGGDASVAAPREQREREHTAAREHHRRTADEPADPDQQRAEVRPDTRLVGTPLDPDDGPEERDDHPGAMVRDGVTEGTGQRGEHAETYDP